jgi:hypothetical protein
MSLLLASCSSGSDGTGDTKDGGKDAAGDLSDDLPWQDVEEDRSDTGELDVKPDLPRDHGGDGNPDADTPDGIPSDLLDALDTETSVPDVADETLDVETDADPVIPPFYTSPELLLKILGPSSAGAGESIASQIAVAGLIVGKPDNVSWETATGQSGYAEGLPFFRTSPIQLSKGDNVITVRAHKGSEVVEDTIVVTHNPVFMFGSALRIRPNIAFAGQASTLLFSMDMGLYSNFDPATLTLCETGPDGECTTNVSAMKDDGVVSTSGDEVGGDGVYSWKKVYNFTAPGAKCFRVHAAVFAGYQQHMAYSPVVCVDVVQRITQESCNATKTLHATVNQLYQDELLTGTPQSARAAVLAFLGAQAEVSEFGAAEDGFGVWALYSSGILGAFHFSPEGIRSGAPDAMPEMVEYTLQQSNVMSKESVVISPFQTLLGSQDEAPFIYTLLKDPDCPPYVLTGPSPLAGANAGLTRFRELYRHGIVALTGHGDSYFKTLSAQRKVSYRWSHPGSQEVIWTGEPVDCSRFVQTSPNCGGSANCPAGSECVLTEASNNNNTSTGICVDFKQADLQKGRLVMGNATWGILPSFVLHYAQRPYPRSVVYLGACRSFWNGTMAAAFHAAGAKAVLGYSGYVTHQFAYDQGTQFFLNLIQEERLVGDAMPPPAADPEYPGTRLRLLGDPNLNATNSELINPSWETGDLTGWLKTGDGRVVSRLGITLPVEGKFMSLISTGMGFTPTVGEIYQTFCIPQDKVEVSFYWKYYSEEFQEFCGSTFQDTFEASIESSTLGVLEMVSVMVDDLCPSSACGGCGSKFVGLIDSDVSFDQGDVWNTSWQKATKPVVQLAGQGPVVVRFYATDKGDSIYDTVILVDAVRFK